MFIDLLLEGLLLVVGAVLIVINGQRPFLKRTKLWINVMSRLLLNTDVFKE